MKLSFTSFHVILMLLSYVNNIFHICGDIPHIMLLSMLYSAQNFRVINSPTLSDLIMLLYSPYIIVITMKVALMIPTVAYLSVSGE